MFPSSTPPGLKCPICKELIPVIMQQLLYGDALVCPHCGLRLIINKPKSKQALEALEKIEESICHLRKTENFRR